MCKFIFFLAFIGTLNSFYSISHRGSNFLILQLTACGYGEGGVPHQLYGAVFDAMSQSHITFLKLVNNYISFSEYCKLTACMIQKNPSFFYNKKLIDVRKFIQEIRRDGF